MCLLNYHPQRQLTESNGGSLPHGKSDQELELIASSFGHSICICSIPPGVSHFRTHDDMTCVEFESCISNIGGKLITKGSELKGLTLESSRADKHCLRFRQAGHSLTDHAASAGVGFHRSMPEAVIEYEREFPGPASGAPTDDGDRRRIICQEPDRLIQGIELHQHAIVHDHSKRRPHGVKGPFEGFLTHKSEGNSARIRFQQCVRRSSRTQAKIRSDALLSESCHYRDEKCSRK